MILLKEEKMHERQPELDLALFGTSYKGVI
jgi:hypothetical protein